MRRGKCIPIYTCIYALSKGSLSSSCADFATTQQIFLEENYRSTGSILAVSMAVVAQGMRSFILLTASSYDDLLHRQVSH